MEMYISLAKSVSYIKVMCGYILECMVHSTVERGISKNRRPV